jgi:hypothetical protein
MIFFALGRPEGGSISWNQCKAPRRIAEPEGGPTRSETKGNAHFNFLKRCR